MDDFSAVWDRARQQLAVFMLLSQVTVDPHAAAKELGIYTQVETSSHLSTQEVVQRIIENRMKYEKRNESRSKKDLAYFAQKQYVAEV